MNIDKCLLIIGAGPFGLAASARASANGVEHVIVGVPMSLWKQHMPMGMNLRSGYDWHIDPQNERTFHHFLAQKDLEPTLPISLDRLLEYTDWFQQECGIHVQEAFVQNLTRDPDSGKFIAELSDGNTVTAATVVCAPGFRCFRNIPQDVASTVAPGHCLHSTGFSDPSRFTGRRVLIIGGRQSAFETAAILIENGAAQVTVVHRHATPRFEESDWSWVGADIEAAEATPGWFAQQDPEIRQSIERHFWEEGRLKLEPWLVQRLYNRNVVTIQHSEVESVSRTAGGTYRVTLGGESHALLDVDDFILATGFKVDVARLAYLSPLLCDLERSDGYPHLTSRFECRSLPGLFFIGLVAAKQFGPYMGFLASCPFAARTAIDAATAAIR